jgi:hypothetical protein
MPVDQSFRCGPLRRDPDGRWFFNDVQIGLDGELSDNAFAGALKEHARAMQRDDIPEWKPPATQQPMFLDVDDFDCIVNIDKGLRVYDENLRIKSEYDRIEGTFCLCCERKAQRYKRTINKQWAAFLILHVEAERRTGIRCWRTLRDLSTRNKNAEKASSDGTYFQYWRFLEVSSEGCMPTELGRAWVRGSIAARNSALVFGERAKLIGDLVSVDQIIGNDAELSAILKDLRQ